MWSPLLCRADASHVRSVAKGSELSPMSASEMQRRESSSEHARAKEEVMPHATRESRGIKRPEGPRGLRRQRVIVAEDEADIRKMVCVALRCLDYDVIEARTGGELLDELAEGLL